MFNYTVIIPYRDTYELLVKACDSIPDRSDVQIIIVDNGETAISKEKVPSKSQARVNYLLSDPLMGAGRARNVGLDHVDGRWVLFLDADDYFLSGAFDVFDTYLESDYDIVFFKPDSIKLSDETRSWRHKNAVRYVDKCLCEGDESYLRYKFVYPWCKLFSSQFLLCSKVRFEEVEVANDAMFSLKTGHKATKIAANNAVVYMITEGEAGHSLIKRKSRETDFLRYSVSVRKNIFLAEVNRKDMLFNLRPFVFRALKSYGPMEALRYVKYAHRFHVHVMTGFQIKNLFTVLFRRNEDSK